MKYFDRSKLPMKGKILILKRCNMKDWQQRVVFERQQLLERVQKLEAFLAKFEKGENPQSLSVEDLFLLRLQLSTMTQYLSVLDKRIENFKEN